MKDIEGIPCDNCKYNKTNNTVCEYCIDYCNYKSVNKRIFLSIIAIPYVLIITGLIIMVIEAVW